jgi:hypothetical protein
MKNPIIDGWYADPEARVYNGKVYIYVTRSLPFEEQHNLDIIVSDDLIHFTKKNQFWICPHLKERLLQSGRRYNCQKSRNEGLRSL